MAVLTGFTEYGVGEGSNSTQQTGNLWREQRNACSSGGDTGSRSLFFAQRNESKETLAVAGEIPALDPYSSHSETKWGFLNTNCINSRVNFKPLQISVKLELNHSQSIEYSEGTHPSRIVGKQLCPWQVDSCSERFWPASNTGRLPQGPSKQMIPGIDSAL